MQKENSIINFILVDDDSINNILCTNLLKLKLPHAEVISFTEPVKGLEYIKNTYSSQQPSKAILYLDINMPIMSGWDFMEAFDKLDSKIKNQLVIYILSSSVDFRDMEKSVADNNITGYFVKPLKKENIMSSVEYLQKLNTNPGEVI